jgi:ketosteroid isomerase-like protein
MSAALTAEAFAEHLRAEYARGFEEGLAAAAPFVADEVVLAHEPVHPADGTKDGPELAAMWRQEGSMLRATMPDVAITDLTITTRAADEVVLEAVLRGTRPDGVVLAHDYRVVYTLRDGLVVRAFAGYDPEPVAELNRQAFQSRRE